MDNKSYLEQISKDSKPTNTERSNFHLLKSKGLIIGAIIVTAIIIFSIFGSIISEISKKDENLSAQISLRTSNLISSIINYNNHVKSPTLRSIGLSLSSALTDTNRNFNTILSEAYKKPNYKPSEKLKSSEKTINDNLNSKLNDAKLNGILDRVYLHELTHQISLLLSLESELDNSTSLPLVKTHIKNSTSNLNKLKERLKTYSDYAN